MTKAQINSALSKHDKRAYRIVSAFKDLKCVAHVSNMFPKIHKFANVICGEN